MTIEPVISPIILDVWSQHVSDPFISIDAVEVLEVLSMYLIWIEGNVDRYPYICLLCVIIVVLLVYM